MGVTTAFAVADPLCPKSLVSKKIRDPLFGLLYLQKPLPVLGRVVWSGVHPDRCITIKNQLYD